MPDEENPDCGQDEENEVRPVELLIKHGGRKEVAEHHHKDDARNHVDQNLKQIQFKLWIISLLEWSERLSHLT